jgi:hypothetical protein
MLKTPARRAKSTAQQQKPIKNDAKNSATRARNALTEKPSIFFSNSSILPSEKSLSVFSPEENDVILRQTSKQ